MFSRVLGRKESSLVDAITPALTCIKQSGACGRVDANQSANEPAA